MDFVFKLLSFDRPMGQTLVRVVFYLGLAGIVLGTIAGMFSGFAGGFLSGIWTIIVAPIGGVIAVLYWRLVCDALLALFRMGDDLAAVRTLVQTRPTAAAPPP